ncbi:MAG: 4-hydroxy-3-methylbut-2-en-1-yl diphosphate synthase, (E)-4-hydroxy-3-methylbut-2-enyl-diphosphate synthase [Candidatus Peregrinibacteria bacterium GW2011_GWE2_39_6]|nr:MAG: 4-hydroxy-3-methylbut-2-en-1-yl diphosphate synthase, (E)-4-hydroxy-3-methylbut-2-enyl-diphosphate synthase [Candidatus Peregrinibacteria bacterium GW2011_GWF2_39_17]KKR25874.1 MAG: 4-hydroxy-3-methylbut-2-en-1-yl diphosphate synthase, (E)-4-hydroxy-3-methylbut-2-enyl-diphosphate synthase [Candidatus Peregrinibacteria bacterium GW2011_GWE2_39_6]HCW32418.1 4-hydroxy-3-methylbut-2-en-1-yl diphosphate synthase [Candidatus Peregrinibacteria bacterium]
MLFKNHDPSKRRRKTQTATIGKLKLGNDYPVAMQSMCSTKTENIRETVAQIRRLEALNCDLVRVAVPNLEAARAIAKIKERIKIPLIADVHFDYRLALASLEHGADKIRINPGNIVPNFIFKSPGESSHITRIYLENLKAIIKKAKEKKACIRIGINSGSLEQDLWDKYGSPCPEAMVESALRWLKFFKQQDFYNLVLSVKSSRVLNAIQAYQQIAKKCDLPLHLGVTEAGPLPEGAIKSAVGLGTLLAQGIGDTIRVSLSDKPEMEIITAKEILKSLKLYTKEPDIISCPTCGRTEINLIAMVKKVKKMVKKEGITQNLTIAVMGCTVNALGEAKEADFAIAGGKKQGNIYYKGELFKGNIPEKELVKEFLTLIRSRG